MSAQKRVQNLFRVASHDGELLILVDLNKLLSDEEWSDMMF